MSDTVDDRPRVTTSKRINLGLLASELGTELISVGERDDGDYNVVVEDESGITQTVLNAAVANHEAPEDPADDPVVKAARELRGQRSELVAQPTAQLLQSVVDRLAAERVAATPDGDLILILEAVRQLALKSISDEAAAGSREYADLYLSHVPDTPL